jgi:hypothetical protein
MHTAAIRLGLRGNMGQFSLLVLVNAFVGAMVGLERSILPAIGDVAHPLWRAPAMSPNYCAQWAYDKAAALRGGTRGWLERKE